MEIVPVKFDAGDRVIITDGPFKDFSGNVIAVNRRNKRLNIQIEFMMQNQRRSRFLQEAVTLK